MCWNWIHKKTIFEKFLFFCTLYYPNVSLGLLIVDDAVFGKDVIYEIFDIPSM